METSTRDISAGGIYFSMTEPCEPGSELELVVTLPSERDGSPVRVHVVGKVIRVEPPDPRRRIGVAAVIEKYEFVTGEGIGLPVPPSHHRPKRHRARRSCDEDHCHAPQVCRFLRGNVRCGSVFPESLFLRKRKAPGGDPRGNRNGNHRSGASRSFRRAPRELRIRRALGGAGFPHPQSQRLPQAGRGVSSRPGYSGAALAGRVLRRRLPLARRHRAVTVVNPKHDTALAVDCALAREKIALAKARILHHRDWNACNTFEDPHQVVPREHPVSAEGSSVRVDLPPLSIVTVIAEWAGAE